METWDAQTHRAQRRRLVLLQRYLFAPLTYGLFWPGIQLMRALGKEEALARKLVAGPIGQFREQMAAAFTQYTPTAHDVVVCSYFKSGTNWAMQIAYQVAHLGNGEFEHIHDVVAWPDAPDPQVAVALPDPRPLEQSPTKLRVIKTHSLASQVPYNEQAKYICVVRDPKDVFVSSYFFFRSVMFGHLMPSVETWLELFLSEQAFYAEWAAFTADYWPWREKDNVLLLSFGEMKRDLAGTVARIAALMGVALTDAQTAEVIRRSSFSYMKGIDHKFYPGMVSPFGFKEGTMIRKGKRGDASELLSKEQEARIDGYMKQALRGLGSDFPYEAYFGEGAIG